MHNIVLLPAQKWGQPGRSAAILQYLPFRRETNESSGPNAPFGAKLISVFHDNFAKGIQSHRGLVLLFDPESGAPVCAVHAGEITAIRTSAASAVATHPLARPDSTHPRFWATASKRPPTPEPSLLSASSNPSPYGAATQIEPAPSPSAIKPNWESP